MRLVIARSDYKPSYMSVLKGHGFAGLSLLRKFGFLDALAFMELSFSSASRPLFLSSEPVSAGGTIPSIGYSKN